jgi:transcription-repair coupling factor (superfamily II helicase)
LGSGIKIAHYDLELRGAGDILGADQSGHLASVGYDLYFDLLREAVAEARGEPIENEIDPEISLGIPALIPADYVQDIRIRLSYYKALSEIKDESDLEHIENELVDRFGPVPEVVGNLFGIMLIRRICKDIGIKDISLGPKNLVLMLLPSAKLNHNALIAMALKDQKKYQMTPDSKLIIRFSTQAWAPILEELKHIKNTAYLKHSVI